jgi:branched-chain amino acid transport system substrate-binding protein
MSAVISRRGLLAGAGAAVITPRARAQEQRPIRIGVLTDLAGINADNTGPGMVSAVKMAVEDAGGAVAGIPVEVVVGDHQGRPDIGLATAREWFDIRHVNTIVDVTQTNVALPISDLSSISTRSATSSTLSAASSTIRAASWSSFRPIPAE